MAKDQFMNRFRKKMDKGNLAARADRQIDPDLMDEEEKLLAETPPAETVRNDPNKAKRSDPCPCGSGKKYKKCCGM